MATLSSLQDRIQGLGSRLQAENDSMSRDIMTNNLTLDFSRERPGSERRPRNSSLAEAVSTGRPNTISARPREQRPRIQPLLFLPQPKPQDSPELKAHMSQIALKNGIITIEDKKYQSNNADLKYIAELGSGTSGNVVKMLHQPSNKIIAVKQMNRTGNLEETKRVFFDLEVVLKSHDCPYIVRCLGCFVSDTHVWICMELMATCLDKLLKRCQKPIPEPILGKISVATVKALHYLKENHGVIHRDVKPSNILLDERGNIKLCDFGISGRLVDSKANTRSAGCAAYMAPERIDPPDPRKPDYDIRADVWSLGITLVELATGQFPYKDCRTDFEVLTKVLDNDPPTLPQQPNFSQPFRDFVKDCLVKDYRQRPKYRRLLDYAFIKQYEKEEVDVAAWFADVWAASAPAETSSTSSSSGGGGRVRSSPHRSSRVSPRWQPHGTSPSPQRGSVLPSSSEHSAPHTTPASDPTPSSVVSPPRLVPRRSTTPDAYTITLPVHQDPLLHHQAAANGSPQPPPTPVSRSGRSGTNSPSSQQHSSSIQSPAAVVGETIPHKVAATTTITTQQQPSSPSSPSSSTCPHHSPSAGAPHHPAHHHHHHHHHSQHPVMGARALSASPLPRAAPVHPLSPPRSAPAAAPSPTPPPRSSSHPPPSSPLYHSRSTPPPPQQAPPHHPRSTPPPLQQQAPPPHPRSTPPPASPHHPPHGKSFTSSAGHSPPQAVPLPSHTATSTPHYHNTASSPHHHHHGFTPSPHYQYSLPSASGAGSHYNNISSYATPATTTTSSTTTTSPSYHSTSPHYHHGTSTQPHHQSSNTSQHYLSSTSTPHHQSSSGSTSPNYHTSHQHTSYPNQGFNNSGGHPNNSSSHNSSYGSTSTANNYNSVNYQNPYMPSRNFATPNVKQYKGSKTSPVGIITNYSSHSNGSSHNQPHHYSIDGITGNSFTNPLILNLGGNDAAVSATNTVSSSSGGSGLYGSNGGGSYSRSSSLSRGSAGGAGGRAVLPPTSLTGVGGSSGGGGGTISASSSTTSSSSASFTPPPLRKTPEPVRFNPEPWAPRGRFTQPASHSHFRSHSSDLSYNPAPPFSLPAYTSLPSYSAPSNTTSSPYSLPPIPTYSFSGSSFSSSPFTFSRGISSSSSRYGGAACYYHPHASPLVSRRLVESRAAGAAAGLAAAQAAAAVGRHSARSSASQSRSRSRSRAESSVSPPPQPVTTLSSPHYRYTQEAFYKSRPYYTPEPQRRSFPRQHQ